MNGKWLLSVGLPLMLLTAVLVAGPMVYMDVQAYPTQTDGTVTYIDPHTVVITPSTTQVDLRLIVWVRSWDGNDKGVGLQATTFGLKSSYGQLLGNLAWTYVPDMWTQTGYLPGANYDMDGDTDKDVGGIYRPVYRDPNYEANFADFPAVNYSGSKYKLWKTADGDLVAAVKGPDSNKYVGIYIGDAEFYPTATDSNTLVTMYPYFASVTALYWTRICDGNGMNFSLGEPFDPNYTNDANLRRFMYVTDLASFKVQSDTPLNIIIPEPTVVCLTIMGAAALLGRRRRKTS